jgi:pilus assembly protein CpaC
MGSTVVLSGQVRDPAIIRKAVELANSQGIPVVDNVEAPAPEQILLHVEFAEVSKSALKEVGGDLLRIMNPAHIDEAFDEDDTHMIETLSEGFVTLLIEGDGARLDAVIRALKNTGEFKSLAQPNLVTREGEEATFLAGGEFPFPIVQSGGGGNAVTIQWREFGIRLNFTPEITNAGNIRLAVEPEVSSLDFANGLTFEGFNIPTLLVRRVQTDVELRPGQTLAIGGMLDDRWATDVDKIPVLGDIPILGFFFRSEQARQDRTELLVLVTPHILDPANLPARALPTGDPATWDWNRYMKDPPGTRPDTTSRGSMDSQ